MVARKKLFDGLIAYIEKNEDNRQNVLDALKPYLNGLVEAVENTMKDK